MRILSCSLQLYTSISTTLMSRLMLHIRDPEGLEPRLRWGLSTLDRSEFQT